METLPDGYYDAKPTVCGYVGDSKEKSRYVFEFAVSVPGQEEPVLLNKYCNLLGDGLQYTVLDAEVCGCDVTKSSEVWMVNPQRKVRLQLKSKTVGEKTYQNISVYAANVQTPGYVITKHALPEADRKTVAADVDARIRMLLASRNGGGHAAGTAAAKQETFNAKNSSPF